VHSRQETQLSPTNRATRLVWSCWIWSCQTVLALLRSAWKKWFLAFGLSRSLKVIGTDTDRSAIYDFLLVFYSNFVPETHRFSDIRLQKCCDLEIRVRGHSRSLKLTRIDPPHDFLLTFHSNHGPISYRFRDIRRFQSKIANFPNPRVFCAPAEWVPLGIEYRRSGQQTRIMGLPGRERSLTISLAVWIQYTNVTDGQIDGQTPGDSKNRAYA